MPDERVSRELRLLLQAGRIQEAVAILKSAGLSKIGSIKVLREESGLPLRDVKRLVHESPAWADVRERDDRFHATLEDALENPQSAKGGQEDE